MHPEARPIRRKRGALLLVIGLLTVALMAHAAPGASAVSATTRGFSQLLATNTLTDVVRGIAVFPSVPSAAQAASLNSLGLTVQPMHKVRLALVQGKVSAMKRAVTSGVALDVYPDNKIQLLDTA